MSSTTSLATFLKNRIENLKENIVLGTEGLGNGTTLYPAKIAIALQGLTQTTNALVDLVPILEEMGSIDQPRKMPFPNMEKPAAELPSDAVLKEILCDRKETIE